MRDICGCFRSTRFISLMAFTALLFCASPVRAQVFQDSFDRADGAAGNGWTGWWMGAWPNDTEISIANGELVTHGSYGLAGGVFRELPVTYPLRFAFDFRTPLTASDNQCTAGINRNEGAWVISFNVQTPTPGNFNPQAIDGSQLVFGFNNPLSYLVRIHRDALDARVEEFATPVEDKPVPGEVSASPMHVTGLVRADGSATLELYFRDGQSPDPVVYEFAPIPGGLQPPKGAFLSLANGSCNTGEHIFDNVALSTQHSGPPASKDECKNGGWELFAPPYRNQGQCIKAVRQ